MYAVNSPSDVIVNGGEAAVSDLTSAACSDVVDGDEKFLCG